MEPERKWEELPGDALSLIVWKLGTRETLWPAQAVCRWWRRCTLQPHLWRRIDMRSRSLPTLQRSNWLIGLGEAIRRSGGHVEELYAVLFDSDDIISFAHRTTGLRCLALESPRHLNVTTLIGFVAQCPLLEEIHISKYKTSSEIYGAIGRARPELKCFRLDSRDTLSFHFSDSGYDFDHDKDALEIANNMAQLHELQIIGNTVTNEGLHAILDKCLHLELLDLRLCHNLNLNEPIQTNLAKIKSVRLPYDSKNYVGEFEATIDAYGFGRDLEYWKSYYYVSTMALRRMYRVQ